MLGIRLTIDKISDWDHAGTDPHGALVDLERADAGSDVTWVIGYITPGDAATKALEELGAADPLGHHLVVRGWAEKPETQALAAILPDLEPPQRAEVVAAHHRHKQTVVLLHELAATLGAESSIPVASVALVLGIHRLMSQGLTPTNLLGNTVATIAMAKWEGALDEARLHRELDTGN